MPTRLSCFLSCSCSTGWGTISTEELKNPCREVLETVIHPISQAPLAIHSPSHIVKMMLTGGKEKISGVAGLFPSDCVKMTTDSDSDQQCKQLFFFVNFVTLFQRYITILLLCVWNLEFWASARFTGTLNTLL